MTAGANGIVGSVVGPPRTFGVHRYRNDPRMAKISWRCLGGPKTVKTPSAAPRVLLLCIRAGLEGDLNGRPRDETEMRQKGLFCGAAPIAKKDIRKY